MLASWSRPGSTEDGIVEGLRREGYEGRLIPVCAGPVREGTGPARTRLKDLPDDVDAAVVVVFRDDLISVLEDCRSAGLRVLAALVDDVEPVREAERTADRRTPETPQSLEPAPGVEPSIAVSGTYPSEAPDRGFRPRASSPSFFRQ